MAHFITDACMGCTLCAKNCPVYAITGTLKQRHVIDADRCVDCGVCGSFCAKGAILDEEGKQCVKIAPQDRLIPVVDIDKCCACWLCVEACGRGALELSKPAFHGDIQIYSKLKDQKLCVGCGMCSTVCPLHAIKMVRRGDVKATEGGKAK